LSPISPAPRRRIFALSEIAEYGERDVDPDVGHADLAGAYARVGSNVFRGLKCFLEKPVEHGAGRATGLGDGIGALHLAEDLGFTEDLRVETGSDVQQVGDSRAVFEHETEALEIVEVDAAQGAECSRDLTGGGGMPGDAVRFRRGCRC